MNLVEKILGNERKRKRKRKRERERERRMTVRENRAKWSHFWLLSLEIGILVTHKIIFP